MSAGSSPPVRRRAARLLGGAGAFLRRSPAQRMAVARVVPMLIRVEAGFRRYPIPKVAERLGIRMGTGPETAPKVRAVPLSERERLDVEAAALVLRRWPARARCLRKALLVGHALRARDPVLRIGVAKHDDVVHAHAWIEVDGLVPEDTERGVTFLPLRRANPR